MRYCLTFYIGSIYFMIKHKGKGVAMVSIISAIGGIGFLLGMNMMAEGLKTIAGIP